MEEKGNIIPKVVRLKNTTDASRTLTSEGANAKTLVELSEIAVNTKSRKNPKLNANAVSDEEFIKVNIGRGVTVLFVKDSEEDYSKLKHLNDVVELDLRKPGVLADFRPPLFKEYINRVNHTIETFAKIGDIVTIDRKYLDPKGDVPRRVIDLYFKSLNNMTVVMVKLEDGDINLSNRLVLCK